jgi:putative oxidoreductase
MNNPHIRILEPVHFSARSNEPAPVTDPARAATPSSASLTRVFPSSIWAPRALALLRMVAALMFMQSGTMKLFGWPMGMPPDDSTAELFTQVGIGGVLEVFGGALIVVGLFTRPVAFVLSGMMAVAYFQFHQPTALWPMMNGGIPAILYCFVFLYLAAAGPGAWSIDGRK